MNSSIPSIRFLGFNEAWEQRELCNIARMNARIGWQNLRTSEFLDRGDYYLITGTDFENGQINWSTCHYVNKYRYDQDPKIQVAAESILITKDGTLGKVAYISKLSKPATLNAGVFNVRVLISDFVNSKYLFHYLKGPFLLEYVAEKANGSTIKHLNQNILIRFPIPLPAFEEQTKLSNLMDCLDDIITLHQRKLSLLKNIKSSLLEKMFV
jgi:type I restriction enzyme S subunit